jgi:hypothetical protein
MQKDYDEHGMTVPAWRCDPLMEKIWPDRRFKDFVKKVGFE